MKILITGVKGQLGQALEAALGQHEIIPMDREALDISNSSMVVNALRSKKPDLVINCAAYNRVDDVERNQSPAIEINVKGPQYIAEATRDQGIPMVHFSTDYVFNGRTDRPYVESDVPDPVSAYGASKLGGEEAVRRGNPKHFIVRTAWLFHANGQNFLKTILRLASKPELRVVDDQSGSPTYAPHLAEAVVKLIQAESYGTYHLAGRGGASWFQFAKAFYKEMGITTPVIPVKTSEFPRPASRPEFSVLDTERRPPLYLPPWEEGLNAFCRIIKEKASL